MTKPSASRRAPRRGAPGRRAAAARFALAPVAAVCAALCSLGAQAQVQLPTLAPGGVIIGIDPKTPSTSGSTMTINQTQTRGVIEWSNFTIGTGGVVNINQPGADSVLLNRVLFNPNGSRIDGALNANGRVFILDPAGIAFGTNSRVSVGGLVAAAMDIRAQAGIDPYKVFIDTGAVALEATNPFANVSVDRGAVIANRAGGPDGPFLLPPLNLNADGGDVVLLAPNTVGVAGTINTPLGRTLLGGGGGANIQVGTSGFVTLNLLPGNPRDERGYTPPSVNIGSTGSVQARSGFVGIEVTGTPDRIEGITRPEINIGGTVDAPASTGLPGTVILDAKSEGEVRITGRVSASTTAGVGGDIAVNGHTIDVLGSVRADGSAGGGTVRLGSGDTASLSISSAQVGADALDVGNGGSVQIRALFDQPNVQGLDLPRVNFGVADLYGQVSARGGSRGGNGGLIVTEASALATRLDTGDGVVSGQFDATSPAGGQPGSWRVGASGMRITNQVPLDASGRFNPAFRGGVVLASDVNLALDRGMNVAVSSFATPTRSGGDLFVESSVVLQRIIAGGPTRTLTLRAEGDLILGGDSRIESPGGPMDVNLLSNSRGTGGAVFINGNIETGNVIATNGGNLVIAGGVDPTTGFAVSSFGGQGASVRIATIDTRGVEGADGSVTIRGEGRDGEGPGDGIFLENAFISAGTGAISLTGRAETGSGIRITSAGSLQAPSQLQASGGITLRGTAQAPVEGFGSGTPTGVTLEQSSIQVGTGGLTIIGRGATNPQTPGQLEAIGIAASEFEVVADAASTSTLNLIGESVGTGGYGVGGAVGAPFSYRIVGTGVTGRTGANVVIGASASTPSNAIDTDGLPPEIATSGSLNVRPIGVDANGNVVDRDGTPIQIFQATQTQNCIASNFCLPTSWLRENDDSVNGPAHIRAGQLVIGSQFHTGAILVDGSAAGGNLLPNITFQNEGAESGGVVLNNLRHPNFAEGRQISVLSAGPVTEGATTQLFIDRLLVRAPEVNLRLSGQGNSNRIGTLAFDVSGSVLTQSFGDSAIGTGTAMGFNPRANGGAGQFTPVNLTRNFVGGIGSVAAFDNLTLNAPIDLGPNAAVLNLSAGQLFQNPSNSPITTDNEGSATWNIFSNTWEGSNRGGLVGSGALPNVYNCIFFESCGPGVDLSQSSGFRYIQRPTLTVTPNATQFVQGQPVPAIGFTVSGFVNGDTQSAALSGALGTTATPQSAPGAYPATAGTLVSPLGYAISVAGGSENTAVTVLPAGQPPVTPPVEAPFTPGNGQGRAYGFAILGAEANSEVNGRNLSRAQMCVAPGALRRQREAGEGTDFLGIEWSRVRSQPHLSNCLEIGDDNECAAF